MASLLPFKLPNPLEKPESFKKEVLRRIVLLNGASGGLGSGLLVEHPSGGTGVLTALHVAVRAILQNKLTASFTRVSNLEIEPIALRLAARSDAALLKFSRPLPQGALSIKDWQSLGHESSWSNKDVYSIGLPAFMRRKRSGLRAWWNRADGVVIPCKLTSMNADNLVVGEIPVGSRVSSSLAGISGGPVFSEGGELIGINTIESVIGNKVTELHITPRQNWGDLIEPFRPGDELDDYEFSRQQFHSHLGLRNPGTQIFDGPFFHAVVNGGVWRSRSKPEHKWGCYGRIENILIDGSRYPINIESVYSIQDRHSRDTWQVGFNAEVMTLFRLMSLESVRLG